MKKKIDNLNRPITINEIEYAVKKKKRQKNLPTNKGPGSHGFTDKFYQTYEELRVILKLFQKTEEEGTLPKTPSP